MTEMLTMRCLILLKYSGEAFSCASLQDYGLYNFNSSPQESPQRANIYIKGLVMYLPLLTSDKYNLSIMSRLSQLWLWRRTSDEMARHMKPRGYERHWTTCNYGKWNWTTVRFLVEKNYRKIKKQVENFNSGTWVHRTWNIKN